MRLLLTQGLAYPDADHRHDTHNYQYAQLDVLDWETRTLAPSVRYTPPAEALPSVSGANLNFKGGCLVGDRFWTVTNTCVVCFSWPDLEVEEWFSHPWMNDCHHVLVQPDAIHIVSTGLDLVLEFSPDRAKVQAWPTHDEPLWRRFDPNTDYRQILSTKPHEVHPNHLFVLDGQVWVTRFQQCDAICLHDHSRCIRIGVGNPHDGLVVDNLVYFTTTNGYVVMADGTSCEVVEVIDLNAIEDNPGYLGWCRGIVVQEDRMWVGFTTLRQTRWKAMASWVKQGGHVPLPSRIVEYDLAQRAKVSEFVLPQDPQRALHGLVAIPATG